MLADDAHQQGDGDRRDEDDRAGDEGPGHEVCERLAIRSAEPHLGPCQGLRSDHHDPKNEQDDHGLQPDAEERQRRTFDLHLEQLQRGQDDDRGEIPADHDGEERQDRRRTGIRGSAGSAFHRLRTSEKDQGDEHDHHAEDEQDHARNRRTGEQADEGCPGTRQQGDPATNEQARGPATLDREPEQAHHAR